MSVSISLAHEHPTSRLLDWTYTLYLTFLTTDSVRTALLLDLLVSRWTDPTVQPQSTPPLLQRRWTSSTNKAYLTLKLPSLSWAVHLVYGLLKTQNSHQPLETPVLYLGGVHQWTQFDSVLSQLLRETAARVPANQRDLIVPILIPTSSGRLVQGEVLRRYLQVFLRLGKPPAPRRAYVLNPRPTARKQRRIQPSIVMAPYWKN